MLYNLSRLDLYIGNDCPDNELNSVKARQRFILSLSQMNFYLKQSKAILSRADQTLKAAPNPKIS